MFPFKGASGFIRVSKGFIGLLLKVRFDWVYFFRRFRGTSIGWVVRFHEIIGTLRGVGGRGVGFRV